MNRSLIYSERLKLMKHRDASFAARILLSFVRFLQRYVLNAAGELGS
jgi:hypothetical protein